MPPPYSNWTHGIPHTSKRAKAVTWRQVSNATVIRVKGATYRNSQPIDDVFELANPNDRPQQKYRALRIEVICSWFGVKPPTSYPNIIVLPNGFTIDTNYSGPVVDDIR